MKNVVLLTLFLLTCSFVYAQKNKQEEAIVKEGIRLYQSEMASWYGTDIFMAEGADQRNKTGGYFSYSSEGTHKCIFFSTEENPSVLATIIFDDTFDPKKANLDKTTRKFTKYERTLYDLRKKALNELQTDTLFKMYQNTSLNLIPIVDGKDKKVYVLTGTNLQNVVFFGNDYLITFDSKNNIESKKKLHLNLIPVEYGEKDSEGTDTGETMHTHSAQTGDLITPTDICTLMLYQNLTRWKTHIVIGEKSLSFWNCETNTLAVVAKDVFEKINNYQSK